jgi:hypothetical protein
MDLLTIVAILSALTGGHHRAPASRAGDPSTPVRLFLDRTRYAPGTVGHVRVHTGQTGYLLVLYAEPDGHVNVAFPLDPRDSYRVPADTDIQIRRRGTEDAFAVDDSSGRGTWYAAISRQPYLLDSIAVNGHWDYRVIPRADSAEVEAALTGFVEGLAVGRFDYDIVSFTIDLAGSLSANDHVATPGSGANAPRPAPAPAPSPSDPSVPPMVGPWGPNDWWPWWMPPRGWPGPYLDGATPVQTVQLVGATPVSLRPVSSTEPGAAGERPSLAKHDGEKGDHGKKGGEGHARHGDGGGSKSPSHR